MIIVPLAAAMVGALVMGTTKPRTAFEKKRMLGPRSGVTYEVEDFVGAGFVVVRAPDGAEGVLVRRMGRVGFDWSRGRGNPATLRLMQSDFATPPPRPSVVPKESAA